MTSTKPLLRGHFHQAMFFVTLGACLLLLLKASGGVALLGAAAFSIGALLMFGISALYHRIHWSPPSRALMKKLDHTSIYIMIAGTFTPVCLLALPHEDGIRLLTIIWAIAAVGLIQSIFFVNLPKLASALIYIVAGYMIVPYLGELSRTFSSAQMSLLVLGGVAYTLGGLAYGLKRPVFNPKVFGYHEVFHVLVSIGAACHFAMVYTLLQDHSL